TFTVTDDDGGATSASTVVTVLNVAPTVSAGSAQTVTEGSPVSLHGTFSDPGSLETFTFTWHVVSSNGQVIADGAGQDFAFTPVDNGTYTASFTVTDSNGGATSSTAVVTALNVAPTASAGPAQTVNEGSPVTLHG